MFVSLSKVTLRPHSTPAFAPPHLISFFAVFIKWVSLVPFYLAGQGGAEEVIR